MLTPQSQKSISYHKNGLVGSHQIVGRWFIFMCFVIRISFGYQQPTCLCVMTEFVVGTISLSCELCSLSKSAFFHVRPAQLCTENGISIYMCSAVEVAWLTQNFRHSSTRVWFRTVAKKFWIGGLCSSAGGALRLCGGAWHYQIKQNFTYL